MNWKLDLVWTAFWVFSCAAEFLLGYAIGKSKGRLEEARRIEKP